MSRRINPITGELETLGSDAEFVRTRPIDEGVPVDGETLVYDATLGKWIAQIAVATPRIIWGEAPIGSVNGVNKTFILSQSVVGQNLITMLNGIILERVSSATAINEFTHVSDSATIILGEAPISGDTIVCFYAY